MKDAIEVAVKKLVTASVSVAADKSHEAMQFTQAVLNLTHALATLKDIEKK